MPGGVKPSNVEATVKGLFSLIPHFTRRNFKHPQLLSWVIHRKTKAIRDAGRKQGDGEVGGPQKSNHRNFADL